MHIPESVYAQFRSYKQGVLPRKIEEISTTAAANQDVGTIIYTVPREYDLVLEAVSAFSTADPAQATTIGDIQVYTLTGNLLYLKRETYAGTNVTETINLDGGVMVPAGWGVRINFRFDSGINSNQVQGHLLGTLIPSLF